MSKPFSVYKHTFPNGKVYIGITCQPLWKRFMGGNGYKKCPKMWNAIMKYGWNNVEHERLFSNLTKQEAEKKEIELIAFYGSVENGYNIDHGGNCAGTHSIETRLKISRGNKGKKKPPCSEELKRHLSMIQKGERNPFYGKHHSEEIKRTHSEFMKGNLYNLGHHHSEEYKKTKSEQMRQKYADGNNPRCKEVIRTDRDGNETRYYSLRKAAVEAGKSAAFLCKAIKDKKERDGYFWRYAV